MARIFLSYRREDSAGHAGRIFDHLNGGFGYGRVFMDVEGIEAGENFAKAIEEAIAGCDTVVAVIGKRWAGEADSFGNRRIDDPEDYVRQEIETALRLGVELVPVVVGGADFPHKQDLPKELAELALRNALQIDDKAFLPGVERLIAILEKTTAMSVERKRLERTQIKKKESKEDGHGWGKKLRRLLLFYAPAHRATWILHVLFYWMLLTVLVVPSAGGFKFLLPVFGIFGGILVVLRAIATVIEPDRTTNRIRRWWLLYRPPRAGTVVLHLLFFLMISVGVIWGTMLLATAEIGWAGYLAVLVVLTFWVREIAAARDPLREKESEPTWFARLLYSSRLRRDWTSVPRTLFYMSSSGFLILFPRIFADEEGYLHWNSAVGNVGVLTKTLLYLGIAVSARGWVQSSEALSSSNEPWTSLKGIRRVLCIYLPSQGRGRMPYVLFWMALALLAALLVRRDAVLFTLGWSAGKSWIYFATLVALLAVSAQGWAKFYQRTADTQPWQAQAGPHS
jgi:hypothetical protein